ncbi:MAG: hypothetical protein ACW99G_03180 [Candidatus Thorarchaeota archaeon]|jgi:hypothetical protein
MPEKLNLNINIPRPEDKLYGSKRISGRSRSREPVNLQSVTRDIRARNLPPEIEEALIKKASSYPHGALPMFRKNIGQHIIMIREVGKTEQ